MKKIILPEIDNEQVANEIGNFIINKTLSFGKNGAVLGLSGGVDSTLTAALTKRAYDKYDKNLELVGYILPSEINSPKDAEDGIKVAERLGIRYEIIDISPHVRAYEMTNPEAMQNKFHKGNRMSEIRAGILHGKSATENKILLGTGNHDEDFGIGYYTLFGDGAVHISPIGDLSKRLVRQLATYLGFADLANRIPTAGLEPGQTDFGDLGYSYDSVELMSEALKQGINPKDIVFHPPVISYLQKDNRDYTALFGKPKFSEFEQAVEDFLSRNKSAVAKASLISPEMAKVTLRYK